MMNIDNSNLDNNSIAALAHVAVEEIFVAEVVAETALNRAVARAERAASLNLKARHVARLSRISMLEIHAEIHAEVEPVREAARREFAAWESL